MNPDQDKVNLAQMVKHLKENLPAALEYEEMRAKIARRRFECLQIEGFTQAEAIEIISRSY